MTQSTKTHLYSALCRRRVRGACTRKTCQCLPSSTQSAPPPDTKFVVIVNSPWRVRLRVEKYRGYAFDKGTRDGSRFSVTE